MGKSTISMAMFNSYVSLPEGKFWDSLLDKKNCPPLLLKTSRLCSLVCFFSKIAVETVMMQKASSIPAMQLKA